MGKGVEENLEVAVEWYRKSAEQGNANGQYLLGCCYESGIGTAKQPKLAVEMYKKAADNDYPNFLVCYKIAEFYESQLESNVKSLFKAGGMLAISVLIPVTNVITVPVALMSGTASMIQKRSKFMKTDAGKDMLRYYRKAEELGYEEAKEKVKFWEQYL